MGLGLNLCILYGQEIKNVPYETLLIEKYVYFDGEREIVEKGQNPTAAFGFMDHIERLTLTPIFSLAESLYFWLSYSS